MISLFPLTTSTFVGVPSRIYETSLVVGNTIAARIPHARLISALKTLYLKLSSNPSPFWMSALFKCPRSSC